MTTKLNLTQASSYLGINRHTMRRLSREQLLPDGYSDGGRAFWFQTTLDAFRFGSQQVRPALQLAVPAIPSLDLSGSTETAIFGRSLRTIPIHAADPLGALSASLSVVAETKPSCLVVPKQAMHCVHGRSVIQACLDSGVSVTIQA